MYGKGRVSINKGLFSTKYGDIALLLPIEVDEQLIKAIMPYWDPSYRCFTFNQENMTLIVQKYIALLRIVSPKQGLLEENKRSGIC